jgi:dihydrolipoamide dehydrogenase
VIEMLPRIVPVEDEDISKELERVFRKQKIRVETGARAENIQKTGSGVKLTLTTKDGKQEQLEAEKLLVAVGRKPNTENIGLENTKVELDRGFIKVDPYQQTAEPGVYAIGDVVAGTPQLAHVATREGMIAVAHMAGKPAVPINRTASPAAPTPSRASAAWGSPRRRRARRATRSRSGRSPSPATAAPPSWAITKASSKWWPTSLRRDSGRPHHRPGGFRADRRSGGRHGSRGHRGP